MNPVKKWEMVSEFKSWEPLILDDLKRLEHRIQSMYRQMTIVGVPKKEAERYVTENLKRLILESVG